MAGISQGSARRMGVLVLLGVSLLGIGTSSSDAAKNEKHLIRLKFSQGRRLKYDWRVKSDLRWYPQRAGLTWGQVDTNITFELEEKLVRESGACTCVVHGKKLKSTVKGPKGTLSISATERSARISTPKNRAKETIKSPFDREMTVTIGPRGGVRYGTGIAVIAPYFRIGVDNIFWRMLTTAPKQAVGVGDEWKADFKLRLPDSRGEPLNVKGEARVLGWKKLNGHRCLVIKLNAKLTLKDTTVTFRNGDRRHIRKGEYEVGGVALWDVQGGILRAAEAEGEIRLDTDKPNKSILKGTGSARLRLLSTKK